MKKAILNLLTSTINENEQDELHNIYCDLIEKNPPPTRHIEQHGLKYITDHFDADNFVVCRDFIQQGKATTPAQHHSQIQTAMQLKLSPYLQPPQEIFLLRRQ